MPNDKKKAPKPPKAEKPPKAPKAPKPPKPPKKSKSETPLSTAKRKAAELAANPAVAEVVAATLVAAAAALRDPKKARAMAETARDELTAVSKGAAGATSPLWQLAMDVGRRSLEAAVAGANSKPKKRSGKSKKKSDK